VPVLLRSGPPASCFARQRPPTYRATDFTAAVHRRRGARPSTTKPAEVAGRRDEQSLAAEPATVDRRRAARPTTTKPSKV